MGLARAVASTTKRLPILAGAAAAAWTAFSATRIPHEVAYPRPVPGEAGTLDTPEAGEVAVYQMGPASGDHVLVVHGVHAAASAFDMRPLYTALAARGFRVTAFDLPGYGHSERHDRTYDSETMTHATTTVLEKVVQTSAHVIGLSLGSEFAAKAAQRRPDLVRSLTLISPTGLERSGSTGNPEWLGSLIRTPILGQAIFDAIASRPSIEYFLDKSFTDEPDVGYRAFAWTSAHQPGARFAPAAFLSGALFDPKIFDTYAAIACPALVIYDRDPYSSFDRLPELTTLPSWEARRIVPSNGLPHYELLDETLGVLQDFFARTSEPGEIPT
jgi:pimeloyl-ACP methyl ester carboxylesterase